MLLGSLRPREKPVPPDFPQGPLTKPLPAISTHAYTPRDGLELKLTPNMRLHILERKGDWWFTARKPDGDEGWVSSSYIKLLRSPQSLDIGTLYAAWVDQVTEALRRPAKGEKKEKLDRMGFPWVPAELCDCEEMGCKQRKIERELGACVHDVEVLMKGAGEKYGAGWLWRESLKWHPDRFGGKLKGGFREEGLKAVGEMFTILTELANRERERERAGKEGE